MDEYPKQRVLRIYTITLLAEAQQKVQVLRVGNYCNVALSGKVHRKDREKLAHYLHRLKL